MIAARRFETRGAAALLTIRIRDFVRTIVV
jgi:hypothetical protein